MLYYILIVTYIYIHIFIYLFIYLYIYSYIYLFMVKCGFGALVFARVLGKPALFFLLRICCITHPACPHILNRKKRRSAAAHACLPRTVLPPLAQEKKTWRLQNSPVQLYALPTCRPRSGVCWPCVVRINCCASCWPLSWLPWAHTAFRYTCGGICWSWTRACMP